MLLTAGLFCSPVFGVCIPSKALLRAVDGTAKKYNLDAGLLLAISGAESCHGRYRYNAKSQDYGLMQINWYTAKSMQLNTIKLLYDDAYSLDAAARILVQLRQQWPLDWPCRYNVGRRHRPLACKAYMQRLMAQGYMPGRKLAND